MADGGVIEYTVSADTGDLLTGERNANRFVSGITGAMKKADNAVDEFKRGLANLGMTVNSTGQVLTSFGRVNKEATRQLKELNAQSKLARYQSQGVATSMTGTAQAVNKATRSFGMVRGGMQNASYQFQDIIVQAQMGTSWFTILAQQGPQLAMSFGAAGAAVGVLIALAGALGPAIVSAFSSGEDAAEEYKKAVDRVNAVVTLSADGTASFTDEVQRLARYSKSAAVDLLTLTKAQNELIQQAAAVKLSEQFKDLESDYAKFTGTSKAQITSLINSLFDVKARTEEIQNTGVGRESAYSQAWSEAKELVQSFQRDLDNFKTDQTRENLDALLLSLNGLKVNGKFANESTQQLASNVLTMAQSFIKGEETASALDDAINRLGSGGDVSTDAIDRASESVDKMADILMAANNELAIIRERLSNGEDAARDLATELEVVKAGGKASSEEVDRMVMNIIKARREARALNDEIKSRERGVSIAEDINTTENVTTRYQTDIADLDAAYNAQLISHANYVAAKRELDSDYARQFISSQGAIGEAALAATNALSSGAANAFDQMLSGSASVEDAMRGLARTIVNSVLQSLIQTAVQYTVLPALAEAFGLAQASASTTAAAASSAAAATTAASTSAAAGSVAAASAPAAAATATWSFGSAAAIGAAALGSIFLLSKNLAGNRRYGGSVSTGNMYQVNESGVPEVYSYGNNDYLMASSNAMVTPLDKFGGSGNMSVNINNYASDSVSVSANQTENGIDINVVSKQVENKIAGNVGRRQGPMYQAIKGVR